MRHALFRLTPAVSLLLQERLATPAARHVLLSKSKRLQLEVRFPLGHAMSNGAASC